MTNEGGYYMLYSSSFTYSQCFEKIESSINEKVFRGFIKNTTPKNSNYSSAKFLLTKKSLKVAALRLPIQIYISGQITESQLDTKIELKIRHGVSSLTEFLFLGCILYILLLYSSKIYNISSQTLVITTTIILIALITLHSYFISKYSHIANEIEKDLFYTIKRILDCSETTY